MNFWDKNKIFEKLMVLAWVSMLFFCIFLLSFISHAADSTYPLPFVVNNNVDLFDEYEAKVTSGSYSQGASLSNDGVIGWFAWESNYYVQHFMIPVHDNFDDFYSISYDTGSYDDFDVVYNRLTLNFTGGGSGSSDYVNRKYIHVYFKQSSINSTGGSFSTTKQTNNLSKSFGFHASSFYTINYLTSPLYDSDGNVVITLAGNQIVGTGHATRPNWLENRQHYDEGDTPPASVPQPPTTNNYSWTVYNPPAFDPSTIEKAIESLGDKMDYNWEYFKDNIHGEFGVITNNIESYFHYVGSTVEYYGNLLNDTIQALGDNIYDNFVSLFEPIANTINYIAEPVSVTVIYDNISSTSLVLNIGTIQTSLTSFQSAFTGVDEPTSYSIPIHLENLPSNWFGNQSTQYIDLGIINGTVKDGLRLFVWAMVTYSLVVTIFDSISNYINGGGDEL